MEVLGKALSPGINGQYTAVLCINQFERALAEMLRRAEPNAVRYDSSGIPRLITQPVSREDFIAEVFMPIRQYARGDWITLRHLLNMINHLCAVSASAEATQLLTAEVASIIEDIRNTTMSASEKRSLQSLANHRAKADETALQIFPQS